MGRVIVGWRGVVIPAIVTRARVAAWRSRAHAVARGWRLHAPRRHARPVALSGADNNPTKASNKRGSHADTQTHRHTDTDEAAVPVKHRFVVICRRCIIVGWRGVVIMGRVIVGWRGVVIPAIVARARVAAWRSRAHAVARGGRVASI